MVDRERREGAAIALRRFLDYEIDNIEYENEYSNATLDGPFQRLFGKHRIEDRALRAISDFTWCFYDDFHAHKLDGEHALSEEALTIANRCILFLKSEYEYEWHETSLLMVESNFTPRGILNLNPPPEFTPRTLTQHLSALLRQPEGDASVWPFFRRSNYELAMSSTTPG
ncbi:MAG: hypothetical protein ABSD59_21185 [Terracidiphilus sp.]|jgi:hypothetical protein